MGHEIGHSIPGSHTWTITPHTLLTNPFPYLWGAQHLSLTPTGITFIQLPEAAWVPSFDLWFKNRDIPQPYLLIEADPNENTNSWDCRIWINHHTPSLTPDDYLLPLTVHAAITEPFCTASIGPVPPNNHGEWVSTWRHWAQKTPSYPTFMTYYQFHKYAINLTDTLMPFSLEEKR